MLENDNLNTINKLKLLAMVITPPDNVLQTDNMGMNYKKQTIKYTILSQFKIIIHPVVKKVEKKHIVCGSFSKKYDKGI